MSALDDATRAAARRLWPNVDINQRGAIQRPLMGGAYVECMVWVPQEEIEAEVRRRQRPPKPKEEVPS